MQTAGGIGRCIISRTSFYDDNRNRRYPFVSTAEIEAAALPDAQIPDSVLLDCGFTFAAGSGFVTGEHSVWLDSVEVGESIILRFASDAPGVVGVPLSFDFPYFAEESQVIFNEVRANGLDPIPGGCTNQLMWYGFAVLGSIPDLIAWAETEGPVFLTAEQHTVEPGAIQNLDKTYVRSANLANKERTLVTDIPGEPKPIHVNAQCIQGPLRFVPGYNCRIDYDLPRNGLVIGAVVGAGDGEPCDEVIMYAGETSPDGGELLSGGPRCTDIIKTVNGVGGPRLSLRGTKGIAIVRDPDIANQLNVTIDPSILAGA